MKHTQAQGVKGAEATLRFMLPLSGPPREAEIWHRILVNMGVTVLFVAGVKQHSGKLCPSRVEKYRRRARPTGHLTRTVRYVSERLRYDLIARLVADEGYMGQASPPLLSADPLRRSSAASLPPLLAAHDCALGISLAHTYRILAKVDAEWLLAAPG